MCVAMPKEDTEWGPKERTPYSLSVSVSQQTKNTEAKRQKGNYNKQEEE